MSDEPEVILPPMAALAPDVPAAVRWWRRPLVWGLAGVVIGAGAVGILWGVADAKPGHTAVSSFVLTGSFELTGDNDEGDDGTCHGIEGYSDIAEGTDVTVYDGAGAVVAEGTLGPGSSDDSGACTFTLSVPDVPSGSRFYQVEISHRGKLTVSAADAKAGNFASTLG